MKFTKKLLACAVVGALVAMLGLAACSGGKKDVDSVATLYAQGYSPRMTEYDETSWRALFQNGDDITDCYKVTASITKDQAAAIEALDIFSDTYEQDEQALYETFTVKSAEDLDAKVPTQADADKWVGKTVADMEKGGFEASGWGFDGENMELTMTDGIIKFDVDLAGTFTDAEYEAITSDDESLAEQVITAVAFSGFDWGVIQ